MHNTDKNLIDAAALQLDEALLALEGIAPTCSAHAALIAEALAAVRAADDLLGRVTLTHGPVAPGNALACRASLETLQADAADAVDTFGIALAEVNRARIEGEPHQLDLEHFLKLAYAHAAGELLALAAVQCELAAQCEWGGLPQQNFTM
jgi:hypothetical protein